MCFSFENMRWARYLMRPVFLSDLQLLASEDFNQFFYGIFLCVWAQPYCHSACLLFSLLTSFLFPYKFFTLSFCWMVTCFSFLGTSDSFLPSHPCFSPIQSSRILPKKQLIGFCWMVTCFPFNFVRLLSPK